MKKLCLLFLFLSFNTFCLDSFNGLLFGPKFEDEEEFLSFKAELAQFYASDDGIELFNTDPEIIFNLSFDELRSAYKLESQNHKNFISFSGVSSIRAYYLAKSFNFSYKEKVANILALQLVVRHLFSLEKNNLNWFMEITNNDANTWLLNDEVIYDKNDFPKLKRIENLQLFYHFFDERVDMWFSQNDLIPEGINLSYEQFGDLAQYVIDTNIDNDSVTSFEKTFDMNYFWRLLPMIDDLSSEAQEHLIDFMKAFCASPNAYVHGMIPLEIAVSAGQVNIAAKISEWIF